MMVQHQVPTDVRVTSAPTGPVHKGTRHCGCETTPSNSHPDSPGDGRGSSEAERQTWLLRHSDGPQKIRCSDEHKVTFARTHIAVVRQHQATVIQTVRETEELCTCQRLTVRSSSADIKLSGKSNQRRTAEDPIVQDEHKVDVCGVNANCT